MSTTIIVHRVLFYFIVLCTSIKVTQKMKLKKTLALQDKIKTLAKRFEYDEIDRAEHLEGLSLLVASKK